MKPASEPTDIIWENRHITIFEKFQRSIIVTVLCGVLLLISFFLIFSAQKNAMALKNKYPKQNCKDFTKEYEHRENIWEKEAIMEFMVNEEIEENEGVALYTGPMQCFCKQKKKEGKKNNAIYVLKDAAGKTQFAGQICDDYFHDVVKSKLYGLSITFIIIAINTVLKIAIVNLVSWIGIDTISQLMGTIAKVVFLAQFFNTGLIILIVNANLTEHQPKAIFSIFNGPFSDYMPQWYLDVGMKIIVTYFVQGLMPFVKIVIEGFKSTLKILIDTKCRFDPYVTRKTNMHSYKAVYYGAEWPIHFKFSDALNIIFLAMLYGMMMPIMFPMAGLILANQRLSERIIVWKYSRQPPSMDDAMCKSILDMLKYAPLLFLFNNYWLIDSKIIFSNAWKYKTKITDNIWSSHLVEPSINQATPILYFCFIALFIMLIKSFANDTLHKLFDLEPIDMSIEVDEDLPAFFDTLMVSEAKKVIAEQQHF